MERVRERGSEKERERYIRRLRKDMSWVKIESKN